MLNLQYKQSDCGLEIAGCRHGLAQHAINMMYGEVYGYALYLQVNYYIPQNVEFFWYDVVFKYWPRTGTALQTPSG